MNSTDFTLKNIGFEPTRFRPAIKNYLLVYYIRKVEEKIISEYHHGQMRTPVHLCIGQEAIPVGISNNLILKDKVTSGHRSHGHYLAKGGNLIELFSEILGRETGCANGRGGSQHLIDLKANFIASAPILGGTIPIASGLAFSNVLKQEDGIVITYFGDAVLEEGILYETLSFSALKKLPILFVVENNNLSVHTTLKQRQPNRPLHNIGRAFNIPATEVFGNDVRLISKVSKKIIRKIRKGSGPHLLVCNTYRLLEHVGPKSDLHLN